MTTACARLSKAKAGLTGSVRMRSACRPRGFPARCARAEHDGDVLAGRDARRHFGRRLRRADHLLGLVVIARGRRQDKGAIADGAGQAVINLRAIEHAVGARRHHPRLLVRPALHRLDQPQARQPEIGHGARRRADVLAELRLDQDHDRRRRYAPAFGFVGAGTRHDTSPSRPVLVTTARAPWETVDFPHRLGRRRSQPRNAAMYLSVLCPPRGRML